MIALFCSQLSLGGAQIELSQLSDRLCERGVQHIVVAGRGVLSISSKPERMVYLVETTRDRPLFSLVKMVLEFAKVLRSHSVKTVFATGPVAVYAGIPVAAFFGVRRRIYRVSGVIVSPYYGFLRNLRLLIAEWCICKLSTESWFVGMLNRERYHQLRLVSNMMRVIPAAIPKQSLGTGAISKTTTEQIRIGYIGNLQAEKGIKFMLQVFSALNHDYPAKVKFIVAGSGKLRGEIEKWGMNERNVSYVGPADPLEFFSGIDVLVHFSRYMEGVPQVIYQAMSHSVPVVAFPHEGIPEEVVDGINGFFVNRDDREDAVRVISRYIVEDGLLAKHSRGSSLLYSKLMEKHNCDGLVLALL